MNDERAMRNSDISSFIPRSSLSDGPLDNPEEVYYEVSTLSPGGFLSLKPVLPID